MSTIFSTIAILGGAGKAGQPLVQQALQTGYNVRLLLRHPADFQLQHKQLTIISGDARDPAALTTLLQGCQALVSTLGNPKGEPAPMLSAVTAQLLPILQAQHIKRYIAVTSLYQTAHEQHDAGTKQAAAYMQQHYPLFMADRERELQLLSDSDLAWTYVRLPYLLEGPALISNVEARLECLLGPTITVADLAQFLLTQLHSPEYVKQAPFVANRQPA
ncbi:NAD(P)-dependent oxidoreductase [Hymenobacter sp. PAMC 26628]|uniref:NAD(P)-dependent oxidoreductase n=1 Tax=Hymenobacter sp. PAMC 26628 TaxID=1484118 RepID=UPI00090205FC|nr:NAD(P)H-binding protein [Hymenobacter sp. PAMC 26628]